MGRLLKRDILFAQICAKLCCCCWGWAFYEDVCTWACISSASSGAMLCWFTHTYVFIRFHKIRKIRFYKIRCIPYVQICFCKIRLPKGQIGSCMGTTSYCVYKKVVHRGLSLPARIRGQSCTWRRSWGCLEGGQRSCCCRRWRRDEFDPFEKHLFRFEFCARETPKIDPPVTDEKVNYFQNGHKNLFLHETF